MKLRNKKTGEIRELPDGFFCSDSLKKICEDWEDYEEPKEYYWIDYDGEVKTFITSYEWQEKMEEIGNYFLTKEEAEKAVEKLKAWKRLKDKGLSFRHWKEAPLRPHSSCIAITGNMYCDAEAREDLDLLFGGEE